MTETPILQLYKVYEPAPTIRRAQKSAAGTMPAAAFQYCEAMRVASSYGWYVFPPKDISLLFDGLEAFFYEEGQWFPVKSTPFEDTFRQSWNAQVPDSLKGYDPPFMSHLFVPGQIQIWSGYLAATAPGWHLKVRPPVNCGHRTSFVCYEGIIESDSFQPFPLFINISLKRTDREIFITSGQPLFQIQPIRAEVVQQVQNDSAVAQQPLDQTQAFDWQGLEGCIRKVEERDLRNPGNYAKRTRRKSREG